jgi:hypothetical protein
VCLRACAWCVCVCLQDIFFLLQREREGRDTIYIYKYVGWKRGREGAVFHVGLNVQQMTVDVEYILSLSLSLSRLKKVRIEREGGEGGGVEAETA